MVFFSVFKHICLSVSKGLNDCRKITDQSPSCLEEPCVMVLSRVKFNLGSMQVLIAESHA